MKLSKQEIEKRLKKANSQDINQFKIGKEIVANNSFQKEYKYKLSRNYGDIKDLMNKYHFYPFYTPKEMLEMGVFGGKYITEIGAMAEFPSEWYTTAKLSDEYDANLNYFKIKASSSLKDWENNKWIKGEDKHGWFIWYCRTFIGRRNINIDKFQVERWRKIRRHQGQIIANCEEKDLRCRRAQRQVLLHWSYNCEI